MCISAIITYIKNKSNIYSLFLYKIIVSMNFQSKCNSAVCECIYFEILCCKPAIVLEKIVLWKKGSKLNESYMSPCESYLNR